MTISIPPLVTSDQYISNSFPRWKLLEFAPRNDPFYAPDGTLMPDREKPVLANPVKHWADPNLAYSWFLQAREWLDDRALLAELDAPVNLTDLPANQRMAARQIDFVARASHAIAQGYNALNVVAMNDWRGRWLYHKWLSGKPFGGPTSEQLMNWFAKGRNFGGGNLSGTEVQSYGRWAITNSANPVFGGARTTPHSLEPAGVIPQLARRIFLERYPRKVDAPTHPNLFGVNAGVSLFASRQGAATTVAIELQENVLNRGFAIRTFYENFLGASVVTRSVVTPNRGRGVMPDGTVLPTIFATSTTEFWDWRATFFDEAAAVGSIEFDPNVKLDLMAPMRAYLDYLSEWVDACLTRSAAQIIEDVRRFVAWANYQQLLQAGGPEAFARSLVNGDADRLAQLKAPDPTAQAVSTLVGGIGASLAKFTFGISALVGGFASAAIKLGDVLIDGDVRGFGKDDLGTYKPTLYRSTLGGDTSRPELGQPSIEGLVAPPRGRAPEINLAAIPALIVPGLQQGIQQRESEGGLGDGFRWWPESSVLPWVAGGLVVAGGVWWLTRQR